MLSRQIIDHILEQEIWFQSAKSGGKWGQNVNKRETKIELLFPVDSSPSLTPVQKQRLVKLAGNAVSKEWILRIVAQEERQQGKNKELAIGRFRALLRQASTQPRIRIATTVPAWVDQAKIVGKKVQSQKKQLRKKILLKPDDF